jgi:3-hydroxyisobutyrate dehydrogenase
MRPEKPQSSQGSPATENHPDLGPVVRPGRSVGIAGVGRMGLPMCARLAGAGFAVVATDVRREARAAVLAADADWVDSVAELGARCDLVITVLPGPREVTAIRSPLIAALRPGSTWIEMSTATPAIARDIADVAASREVRTLDAPIGGNPAAAREGRLLAFVGASVDDLKAQRDVLDTLAGTVLHVGAVGSGYVVKLLVNLIWFGQAVASAEALALAVRAGLNPETVRKAVQHSAGASRFMEHDARALMHGDDLTSFSLARCLEELSGVLALGGELDVSMAMGERVTELYAAALERYGDVDGELLAARLVAERSHVDFSRTAP